MNININVSDMDKRHFYNESCNTDNIDTAAAFIKMAIENVMNYNTDLPIVRVDITCTQTISIGNSCNLLVNPHLEHVYALDQTGWWIDLNVFMKEYVIDFLIQASELLGGEHRVNVYTTYAPDTDTTFIMEDHYFCDNLVTHECVGFHSGEPCSDSMAYANRNMVATF